MSSWLPVVVACCSVVAAVATAGLAVAKMYLKMTGRIEEIHVLVNARLTEALSEIRRLGGDSKEF